MKKENSKQTIGFIDHLALPEFKINQIPCKIDTGAYTSTLHCSKVRIIKDGDKEVLCFRLYDPKFGINTQDEFRFEDFQERKVKSSNGQVESRYSIKTSLILFKKKYKVEFTLSSRDKMRFPILLGRRFLRKKFIVDVSLKNLSSQDNTLIK